jgi:hypothetical protein
VALEIFDKLTVHHPRRDKAKSWRHDILRDTVKRQYVSVVELPPNHGLPEERLSRRMIVFR